MINLISLDALRLKMRNAAVYLQVAVLVAAGIAPLISMSPVDAAQLTSRSVTISTSEPSASGVSYGFKFSWANATAVRGVVMQFCTTALGTCTLPTGMNVSTATVTASTGFPGGALSTTKTTTATGDCTDPATAAATMVCLTSASTTSAAGTDATITLGTITNPSLVAAPSLTTVYARVSLYAGAAFVAPAIHTGTVATAITRQLTVSGRVQERLLFCVAAIGDGGAADTTVPTSLPTCAALTNTVVDLGIIDNTTIASAPVDNTPPSSQGNDQYGIAMVNTNASGGVAVTYFAEPDTTSGAAQQLRTFRVPGATCDASDTTVTDQCFQPAVSTGGAFTAGTERFGLAIPCILAWDGASGSTNVNGLVSTTRNLSATGSYDGSDNTTTSAADCENTETGNNYAWNTTNAAVPIASSTTVVDNEIVKLKFAATASATTPTGAYTVRSTYIATPVF